MIDYLKFRKQLILGFLVSIRQVEEFTSPGSTGNIALNVRSRVRPRGVFGIEIWMYCGDEVPVDDGQFKMYTTATRMSANVAFTSEQAGKTAWYQFRYVNTRGEVGPWSMTYSSTVLK
jgi:hypothetical protein